MAIVIVILGLVIGGVRVGQDLIHAAGVRASIRQIEQLNTAVNAFKLKYNCLPGDCATAYEQGVGESSGIGANGDGNGIINEGGATFYRHLYKAKLLSGLVDTEGAGTTRFNIKGKASATEIDLVIDFQGFWEVGFFFKNTTDDPAASFVINPGHYIWATATGFCNGCRGTAVLSPADAFAIDSKLDDGLPRSGRIVATSDNVSHDDNGAVWGVDENGVVAGGPGLPNFDVSTHAGPAGANSDFCVTTDLQYNIANTSRRMNSNDSSVSSLCSVAVGAGF